MRQAQKKIIDWNAVAKIDAAGTVVGEIVDVTPEGMAVVDFPGNPLGALAARSAVQAPPAKEVSDCIGAKVLVTFENRDLSLPIIVGFVRDALFPPAATRETTVAVARPEAAVLDGNTVRLTADEEIVLSCGHSAIILKKDGRVVVRGIEITQRAARCNKIKGGKVQIN